MICASCGRAFEAKRADARYCGAVCRKRASRHVTDVTAKCVTDVTDNQQDDGERELQQRLLALSELLKDDADRLDAARAICDLAKMYATVGGKAALDLIMQQED
jgi:hypothetical protein